MKADNAFLRLVAGLAFALSASTAHATIITNGCASSGVACTLQELLSGGTITIDDKNFTNWTFSDSSFISVEASGINVVALDDQALNPGLEFQFGLSSRGSLFDFVVGFQVATADGTARIKDNSLELTQFTREEPAKLQVFETITEPGGTEIASKFVGGEQFVGPLTLFDSATFTPQSVISVEKRIILEGGIGGTAGLGRIEQRFSQISIPEPTTLALMSLGLAGIGYRRHRSIEAA